MKMIYHILDKIVINRRENKARDERNKKIISFLKSLISIITSSIVFSFLTGVAIVNHPHQKTHILAKHMSLIDEGGNQ